MFANETHETKGFSAAQALAANVGTTELQCVTDDGSRRFSLESRAGFFGGGSTTDGIVSEVRNNYNDDQCHQSIRKDELLDSIFLTIFISFHFLFGCIRSVFSSVQPQAKAEQRQAHFRSTAQAHPQSGSAQPQTGLGILMNNSNSAATAQAPAPVAYPPHLTPEQQVRLQADLADREQQASSLAAAGMVADSVDYNARPATSVGQVLRAPPALVGMPVPAGGPSSSVPLSSLPDVPHAPAAAQPPVGNEGGVAPHMESINWNLDADNAPLAPGFDDIDMDFATLFDTEEQLRSFGQ